MDAVSRDGAPRAGGARAHVRIDRTVAAVPDALRGKRDGGLFDDVPTPLFLIDGGNLLWRAAHSHPAPFPAADGRDLTPLFRFITKLRQAVGTYGVFAECIVCFDGADAWAGRLEVDATYKGNRDYEAKDLSFMGWLPEIRAALDCAGVANVEVSDSEADDVIATFTATAGRLPLPRPVRILSTDRDYFQLISSTTSVVNPKARPALVDAAVVEKQYGVTPAQWCDVRALAGDPSDGIPGVPNVGMQRAAALLRHGRTLDDLRDVEPVARHWDDVLRWRELIRLRTDVAIGFEPMSIATPRLPSPSAICAELGLVPAR
jgi:DNA polymerase-1